MRQFSELSDNAKNRVLTEFVTGRLTFSEVESLNNVDAESLKYALTDFVYQRWQEFRPLPPTPEKAKETMTERLKKIWVRFRCSFAYDVTKIFVLCALLMFAFVNIPRWLSHNFEIDPLSNIYISNGFTALYYLVFALLGISLILLFLDRKSYMYLNPSERTTPDYLSELFQAKPLLRCVLIPFKYYFYLLLFVLLLMYTGKGLVPE